MLHLALVAAPLRWTTGFGKFFYAVTHPPRRHGLQDRARSAGSRRPPGAPPSVAQSRLSPEEGHFMEYTQSSYHNSRYLTGPLIYPYY